MMSHVQSINKTHLERFQPLKQSKVSQQNFKKYPQNPLNQDNHEQHHQVWKKITVTEEVKSQEFGPGVVDGDGNIKALALFSMGMLGLKGPSQNSVPVNLIPFTEGCNAVRRKKGNKPKRSPTSRTHGTASRGLPEVYCYGLLLDSNASES
ncbi:hypothetical protein EV2_028198 [Malus domestica]